MFFTCIYTNNRSGHKGGPDLPLFTSGILYDQTPLGKEHNAEMLQHVCWMRTDWHASMSYFIHAYSLLFLYCLLVRDIMLFIVITRHSVFII